MITDIYGQQIYTQDDLCKLFLENPNKNIKNMLVSETVDFNNDLELENIPELIEYTVSDQTIEEFDQSMTSSWFMPENYKQFDISKYVLDKCTCDAELQRVGEELLLYQERDMLNLLRYLKYLVDTMRENNIVWGVGRGSSVSSFVLYLIGVHKINSLYYGLDINEFLR